MTEWFWSTECERRESSVITERFADSDNDLLNAKRILFMTERYNDSVNARGENLEQARMINWFKMFFTESKRN